MNISELEAYMNNTMKLSSEILFHKYLSKIFTNLTQREDNTNNSKTRRFSREHSSGLFLQKDVSENNLVPDKLSSKDINLSLNNFLENMNIQEFIRESK